jgi:hypothetical protein
MNRSRTFSLLILAVFSISKSILFIIFSKNVINIAVRVIVKTEIYKLVDILNKKCKFVKCYYFSAKTINILVVTKFSTHIKRSKILVMFLFVFILFICGNIELNPGPKPTKHSNGDNSSYFSCETDSIDGNPYALDSNQLESYKGLKIIDLNVQSIRNKFDEIKTYCLFLKLDIFSLTETWLKSEDFDYEFNITGYGKFRRDRNTNRKSGGDLVFINLIKVLKLVTVCIMNRILNIFVSNFHNKILNTSFY